MTSEYEIVEFKDQTDFRAWLDANHNNAAGIWLRIYKKASTIDTVTYAQALDEALCYGWIDGQRKKYDEISFLQKYTPRRPKSLWSKRNIEYIQRLSDAGLMSPMGLSEVQNAQEDGRWAAAYDGQGTMTIPDNFLKELRKHPKAAQFFKTLNKTNLYAIGWRLQTAKTETTRLRRQEKIITMLNNEDAIHS